MIEVSHLTRVFRTYKKQPGFWGGVKGLFRREFEETAAAKDVSFSIAEGARSASLLSLSCRPRTRFSFSAEHIENLCLAIRNAFRSSIWPMTPNIRNP